MSCKYQEHLSLGMQFIFDPTTNKIKTTGSGSSLDLEIYKITPKGRRFVGKYGLVDNLWIHCFDLLCENTLESVTFYSESYTKAMMPDRLAGNQSDLMIAYSRVYREVKRELNITDSDISVRFDSHRLWKKRILYDNLKSAVPPYTVSRGTTLQVLSDQQVLLYPFLFRPDDYPDILRYYKDVILYISGGDALLYIYKGILMENGSSFPNVELKPDLNQNISSTNIDPFNILL